MSTDSTPFVPTIDISPYLDNPRSEDAIKVINDVRKASISSGFFQIIGHKIPRTLQEEVFRAAKSFFALPFEEKMNLAASKFAGNRGYDVLASQSYEEGVLPDLKEGYYIGKHVPESDPLHGRFFMGPNVWPPRSLLPESEFQHPCEQYYDAIQHLAIRVHELVGETMALNNGDHKDIPAVMRDIIRLDSTPACPLRLLHYPSAIRSGNNPTGKPQYGASAHTDFGTITLLLQDENPGLEVLEVTDGKNVWRPIDPNPEAYVVNIGDMVSMVTNGVYKSSMHRVVCKRPENERYSIVFFLDGCLDAVLEPVKLFDRDGDGGPDVYRTVEEHMKERIAMSYGTKMKDPRREGKTLGA
ncbi:hypothetical protein FQN57_001303 [Myotisia sp. PD_48]|nr:hypothetical protein FQN57_001303 [Myotisia sp. PD_48]